MENIAHFAKHKMQVNDYRRQTFTDEMITLMTIEEVGKLTKKPTSRPTDITDNHIGYLCNSLVRRGYLAANSLAGYQLTSKGWNAILREGILLVACGDEAWVKDRMEKLEWLYAEISQQIDDLQKRQQRFSLDKEYSTILQV